MARTHDRSTSPEGTESGSLAKRLKTTHAAQDDPSHIPSPAPSDPIEHFAPEVLDHTYIQQLHAQYLASEPFKHVLVEKLFQDDLLKKVKDECLSELNFTEKETDIYKVNQTGDLASLSYLTDSQIKLLPNLLTLRDALYSQTFRNFLRTVTGCGPLSGKKQDMSVNSYTKGCHLLNHDDVIGTRRVSYILYMPLPHYQLWQKEWGGALELYQAKEGPHGQMEPQNIPSKTIPPSWNQFILFEVQPGRSFHSVEEVVVGGEGEDGRERLSISGWFHAAQEGEEGYVPEPEQREVMSSREQLTSASTTFISYPKTVPPPVPNSTLSEDHVSFLSEFLNPVYLQPRTMKALASRFVEESSLELHHFLSNELSISLEPRLRELDFRDELGLDRGGKIPLHTTGTTGGWALKGPPHKWRYCVLRPKPEGQPVEAVLPRFAHSSPDGVIRSLQDELFPSQAFRAWLAIVSRVLPMSYSVEARRFRPGLDYTLATSEETEARLDVVLGLTPDVQDDEGDEMAVGIGSKGQDPVRGWQAAEWGGWECYLAPQDEDDDPAIYRTSSHKKKSTAAPDTHLATMSIAGDTYGSNHSNPRSNGSNGGHSFDKRPSPVSPPIPVSVEQDDGEEENTLLTVQSGFNRLLLVLRDERVMRFVKYVSAAAEGSRWDVCGEYEIGMFQEDDSE